MYSFAAMLLGWFARHSVHAAWVNTAAATAALGFFGLAILTYIIHGALRDTSNQLRRPHRVGRRILPPWMTPVFVTSLILAEVGGAFDLGSGAMLSIWR